jgi:hypothetical protein
MSSLEGSFTNCKYTDRLSVTMNDYKRTQCSYHQRAEELARDENVSRTDRPHEFAFTFCAFFFSR